MNVNNINGIMYDTLYWRSIVFKLTHNERNSLNAHALDPRFNTLFGKTCEDVRSLYF